MAARLSGKHELDTRNIAMPRRKAAMRRHKGHNKPRREVAAEGETTDHHDNWMVITRPNTQDCATQTL